MNINMKLYVIFEVKRHPESDCANKQKSKMTISEGLINTLTF